MSLWQGFRGGAHEHPPQGRGSRHGLGPLPQPGSERALRPAVYCRMPHGPRVLRPGAGRRKAADDQRRAKAKGKEGHPAEAPRGRRAREPPTRRAKAMPERRSAAGKAEGGKQGRRRRSGGAKAGSEKARAEARSAELPKRAGPGRQTGCGAQAEGAAGPQRADATHREGGEGPRGSEARADNRAARPDERACATTGTACRPPEAAAAGGKASAGATEEAAGRRPADQQTRKTGGKQAGRAPGPSPRDKGARAARVHGRGHRTGWGRDKPQPRRGRAVPAGTDPQRKRPSSEAGRHRAGACGRAGRKAIQRAALPCH